MPEILEKALNHLPKSPAEWIGLREVCEKNSYRHVRDGKPQSSEVVESHGVMAEALVDGTFAYASTSDLTPDGIRRAIEQAVNLAKRAASYQIFKFSPDQRPATQTNYNSPVVKPLSAMTTKDLMNLLTEISLKLKISDKIIRTSAIAHTIESEMNFVSTNGSKGSQIFTMVSGDFESTAQDGSLVQRRSDAGFRGRSYQGGLEYLFGPTLWERVQKVAEQNLELLKAEPCPTEKVDLLLMPDQMMLQIHESVGHPLELDRILGDERNYAGWSFVKPEDFGKLRYGSKTMNITFDPTLAHEVASYAFDDIGNPAKKEFLIKDGLLLRGLGSLESQARLRLPGVANQRASLWNRAPIDRMANLNLEPGSSSLEEMISSTKRGVMMTTNRSWSIDDFRNKFQFGCEYARLIEDGKITKTLRNPNYRGISVPFWSSLKMVGNAKTFETYATPYCGKGEPNQIIRVGHASPACLFGNVEVFGGAS
jgi:predicted Zn-dependent protease